MGDFREKQARESRLRELYRKFSFLQKERQKLVQRLFTKGEYLEFFDGRIKAGDVRFDRAKLAQLVEVTKKWQEVGKEIFQLDPTADNVTRTISGQMTEEEKNEELTKGFSFREEA